ncbi:hypothetical protein ACFQY4_05290 [Catellatospora bangladeshensis]
MSHDNEIAPTWRLTATAYTVSPTTPLCRDMGDVMELMHRMGTVSIAQLAVRLGRPRLVITLILRALVACGWAVHPSPAR